MTKFHQNLETRSRIIMKLKLFRKIFPSHQLALAAAQWIDVVTTVVRNIVCYARGKSMILREVMFEKLIVLLL
jgi:hypothetical protein